MINNITPVDPVGKESEREPDRFRFELEELARRHAVMRRELDRLRLQNQELRIELTHRNAKFKRLRDNSDSLRFLVRATLRCALKAARHRLAGMAQAPSNREAPAAATPRSARYDGNFHAAFTPYEARVLHPLQPYRPRVLHLIGNFNTGGSARLVVDLYEHLEHRFEQRVLTARLPAPPHYTRVPVTEHQRFSSDDDAFDVITAFGPDLIHVHYVANPDLSYSVRGWEWYNDLFRAIERYRSDSRCKVVENVNIPVAPYVSRCVDRYVYVSEYVREEYGRLDGPNLTVYPGSDLSRFHRRHDAAAPDDSIGMICRLEPDKLDERSIDPFIEAVRRRPGTKAWIIGGGHYLEAYRRSVEHAGVADTFTFTGYVAYDALPSLLERMSVFVAAVHTESFGQVSPFAMSMGLPVVGYRVGALPELIGDDTLLAPPGESGRLAAIITELLDDRERRLRIGEHNRRRAQDRYSVETMVDAYGTLYDDLLASVRNPSGGRPYASASAPESR